VGVAAEHPQAPAVQTCAAGHACPHVPQFALLVCVFAQAPAQLTSPAAQQFPLAHALPPHECPQVPQFSGFVETSTQPAPPQSSGNGVPAQVQPPAAQVDRGF
jgi:hypothetical protein